MQKKKGPLKCEERRAVGRPKMKWLGCVDKDLRMLGVVNSKQNMLERTTWKSD